MIAREMWCHRNPSHCRFVQRPAICRREAVSAFESNPPPYSAFSKRTKHLIILLAAWGGFFSPLSAGVCMPILTALARDFRVSNTLINFTLASYMIFSGIAPTIFGDCADMA